MIEGEKGAELAFAEIAHAIKEPYFPGRDAELQGRVHPYPVYRISKSERELERAIYGAIANFYRQEMLARLCPNPYDTAGELYETIFYETLLPSAHKPFATMIHEVALVSLESKLNYTKKWAMFPGFISHDFERRMESRGAGLLLDALKLRWGKDAVEQLHSMLDQLPLDISRGFNASVSVIDNVIKQLHAFVREQDSKKDGTYRPASVPDLGWAVGGLYGEIMLEKGPPIAFL
jgi:hypothetical protein